MDSTRIVGPFDSCTIREHLCLLILTPGVLSERNIYALQNIMQGLQYSAETEQEVLSLSAQLCSKIAGHSATLAHSGALR